MYIFDIFFFVIFLLTDDGGVLPPRVPHWQHLQGLVPPETLFHHIGRYWLPGPQDRGPHVYHGHVWGD